MKPTPLTDEQIFVSLNADHDELAAKSDKKSWSVIVAMARAIADTRDQQWEEMLAKQEPVISTDHGPWVESLHPGEEGERYCKRCLMRDKFLGSRSCDPHIVYKPAAGAQPQPVNQALLEALKRNIPGGKKTDEWDSARVGDYNTGWNDYRKAVLAAIAQAEAQQGATE